MKLLFYPLQGAGIMHRRLSSLSRGLFILALLAVGAASSALADSGPGPAGLAVAHGPEKGYFLVASKDMTGAMFKNTVILLVSMDEDGAVGLIVNRPTPHTLGEGIPALKDLRGADRLVFDGGPVDRVTLQVLFRSEDPPAESVHVFDDVYYSRNESLILGMVQLGVPPSNMRLYAGYAGWAPGQLEMELKRGGWHLVKADADSLFDEKYDELWRQLVPGAASRWVMQGAWQGAIARAGDY